MAFCGSKILQLSILLKFSFRYFTVLRVLLLISQCYSQMYFVYVLRYNEFVEHVTRNNHSFTCISLLGAYLVMLVISQGPICS